MSDNGDEHVDVHMRDSDAFSWYMEKDPLLRSTVVSVMVLDGSSTLTCSWSGSSAVPGCRRGSGTAS